MDSDGSCVLHISLFSSSPRCWQVSNTRSGWEKFTDLDFFLQITTQCNQSLQKQNKYAGFFRCTKNRKLVCLHIGYVFYDYCKYECMHVYYTSLLNVIIAMIVQKYSQL